MDDFKNLEDNKQNPINPIEEKIQIYMIQLQNLKTFPEVRALELKCLNEVEDHISIERYLELKRTFDGYALKYQV